MTPLLGGFIADKYLGRYWTILLFCSIYAAGLALVVVFSSPDNINQGMFFFAMYIIALGTGGIKPNVSTMGADQFDDNCPADAIEKESYFNWFYWYDYVFLFQFMYLNHGSFMYPGLLIWERLSRILQ